jgi:hypothetical protein
MRVTGHLIASSDSAVDLTFQFLNLSEFRVKKLEVAGLFLILLILFLTILL